MDRYQAGSNLCRQLLHRESCVHRDNWYYQTAIYRERLRVAASLYQRDLIGHWGCVNALEFSNGGAYLASGGDDKRVLIWDVEKSVANVSTPRAMHGEHSSNIFCLGFDNHNLSVYSGGNDEVMILHDFETGKTLNCFAHDSPVYGLSVDKTTNNLVSTATEGGELLVYDMRTPDNEPLEIANFHSPCNAVEFHPLNGNYLVSANSRRGAVLWDMRNCDEPVIQYNYITESPSCMSVRFNVSGKYILTLHRRLPPILYSTNSKEPVCTFFHSDYFNSCTMKSCTFAGPDDELVLSGSDDFNLYAWRLKDVDLESTDQWMDTADLILYGHRSIVNQVRYNRQRCLIASSGVEKLIKLWSPFEQKDWSGNLLNRPLSPPKTRELYSPNSMSQVSQDFNSRNTDEDPHMMAFFDSLVQRELEGWETDSSHYSMDSRSAYPGGGSVNESDTSGAYNGDSSPNDSEHLSDSSWQAYPNRISYLISKKRRALLRLAIKCSTMRGNLPRRVRTKSPVSHIVPQNVCLPTPPMQSNRNHLYASPTRMQCWLAGFEAENYSSNDDRATTSAAALSRAAATIGDSYNNRSPTNSSSSEPTTESLSEEDLPSNNGSVQRNGGVRESKQQLKRKNRHRRYTNIKRSRTDNAIVLRQATNISENEDDDNYADDDGDHGDADDDDEDDEDDDDNVIVAVVVGSVVTANRSVGNAGVGQTVLQSHMSEAPSTSTSARNGRQHHKATQLDDIKEDSQFETNNNNNGEANNNTSYSNNNNINIIYATAAAVTTEHQHQSKPGASRTNK